MDHQELTEYEIALACAWSDYRRDYGIKVDDMAVPYKAFSAGFQAAYQGDQSSVLR